MLILAQWRLEKGHPGPLASARGTHFSGAEADFIPI
jgi:hypothetical protein